MKHFGFLLLLCAVINDGECDDQFFNTVESFQALNSHKIVDLEHGHEGYLWVATENDITRFDGTYFKYLSEIITPPKKLWNEIVDIAVDPSNQIWILTAKNGLFIYDKTSIRRPVWHDKFNSVNDEAIRKVLFKNDFIWLINQNSVTQIAQNNIINTTSIHGSTNDDFKHAVLADNHTILIANKQRLISFDIDKHSFQTLQFSVESNPPFIWDIHVDKHKNRWLATDRGLFISHSGSNKWQPFQSKTINTAIKSISSDAKNIWFAAAINGLFQYDLTTQKLIHHKQSKNQNSLPTNELSLVYVDPFDNLWLTSFDNKLMNTTPHLTSKLYKVSCSDTKSYYRFSEVNNHFLMVAQDGIVIQNKDTNDCQFIQTDNYNHNDTIHLSPQAIAEDSRGIIWVGGRYGLVQLREKGERFVLVNDLFDNVPNRIKFIAKLASGKLLIGTHSDLLVFDPQSLIIHSIIQVTDNEKTRFTDYVSLKEHTYMATTDGVLIYDDKTQILINNHPLSERTQGENVTAIALSGDAIFYSVKNKGLYFYHLETNQLNEISHPDSLNIVYGMVIDDHGYLWASSNIGIIRINQNNNKFLLIDKKYGLQDYSFILRSSYVDSDGLIYFGTKNGLLRFNPLEINYDKQLPSLAITQITRFNQPVVIGQQYDGFQINTTPNDLKELGLTYKDRVMGFQFTVLDLINNAQYDYAYRLEGFDPDWSYISSTNPSATYTNLPSGEYLFKIKAKNSNNQWLPDIKTIKIKVKPAPWLSWWAFVIYILTILIGLYLFVNFKVKASKKLAQRLAMEVADKTKTLNQQKKTIAQLLERKNELFSQITHEFRTPLTLILGPLKDILQEDHYHKNKSELEMIARNANRLLTLVEQLLSLAKVSNLNHIKLINQKTQKQITSVIQSFQYLAKQHKVTLVLNHNEDVTIHATEHCIDGILGNLVSNAIKYSKSNSVVEVDSFQEGEYLIITIKDTGPGLTDQDKKDIFSHFNRLPQHYNIEGLGIGLSVVEELVNANKGVLSIHSEIGVGSQFCIKLPLAQNDESSFKESENDGALITQLSSQVEVIQQLNETTKDVIPEDNDRYSVLIIEDNNDMRDHINRIVSEHYHCYLANNGHLGIQIAIERVPDMIICDVMMPEMDGFKVSRVIRSDDRTSHIPLMLLTALNDQKNRIKGWREQIDSYMVKPFDRKELLIRIENILTIRDILKKKTGLHLSQTEISHTDLPKLDKQFVEKLQSIYAEHYKDPLLSKSKVAHLMAVSERQLQRKLKALIDKNPMDMLRDYRLKRASELLKEGHQVGLVSDECGFNSPSYFSQCFKAQYGYSPKQYQQMVS